MTRRYTLLSTLLAALLLVSAAPRLHAQDLNVYMTASSEVVGPGDWTAYTLTVTNTGAVELSNASAEVTLPESIRRFGSADLSCGGFCDPGETTTWTIGTLPPGQSRAIFYAVRFRDDVSSDTTESSVIASATGSSDATASLEVVVDPSPLLRLSLAPSPGPVVAGEAFTYTLTYGNVGSTSPTGVVLEMPVPERASFVSASDGGTESGGVVTWNLGTVGVGAGGQVQVTVLPNAALGDGVVLRAAAELDPNVTAEPVARSSATTPVKASVPLELAYSFSQTALGPGDVLDLTLTVTNKSTLDLTGVAARLLLPGFVQRFNGGPELTCGGFCDPFEQTSWDIGTLPPGQSVSATFRTRVASSAPQGEVLRSLIAAISTSTGQVSAAQDLHVDPSLLLRLSLAPDAGPVAAGEALTYTITLGNIGSDSPPDIMLRMLVPERTTFVSASDGGTPSGGFVTWTLGALGVGSNRQLRLTVLPDASLSDGELITAFAELDPNAATESVVRASAVVPVRSDVPLHLAYSLSETALGPGNLVDVALTASNSGVVDLTNVSAQLILPDFITRFGNADLTCGGFCDPNEKTTWTIGTLAPGQSKTTTFRTRISSSAPQGELLRSLLTATAATTGQVTETQSAAVDPSPLLRLSLSPGPGPAVAGEAFTYTLTVGNIGSHVPTGIVLRMPVPEATTFDSASDGGVLQNGVVSWPVGTLGVGAGGQAQLTVVLDEALADGSILEAEAGLDPMEATESVVHAQVGTPVRAEVPLRLKYMKDRTAVEPGETVAYTLTVLNEGNVSFADLSVQLQLPGFIGRFGNSDLACGGFCDPNEKTTWNVGTLAPGESDTLAFEPVVSNSAPRGEAMRSLVLATATGSNEVIAGRDVLIGMDEPLPVELAAFTAALDGEAVLLQWQTASETGNAGFAVEHRRADEGAASEGAWQELAFRGSKASGGTSTEALSYDYRAEGLGVGQHVFRLRQVDLDGTESLSEERTVEIGLAGAFALSAPAPNPFRQRATFTLAVKEAQEVQARVYDVLGRRVAVLHEGPMAAGQAHRLQLEAGRLASGLYLVRITGERFAPQTRRVVLMR